MRSFFPNELQMPLLILLCNYLRVHCSTNYFVLGYVMFSKCIVSGPWLIFTCTYSLFLSLYFKLYSDLVNRAIIFLFFLSTCYIYLFCVVLWCADPLDIYDRLVVMYKSCMSLCMHLLVDTIDESSVSTDIILFSSKFSVLFAGDTPMHISQLEGLAINYAFLQTSPYYANLMLTKECPKS